MTNIWNTKTGPTIAIPFHKANATTGLSNSDMFLAGGVTTTVAPMPKAGSIVGISVHGSAATTAGSIIFTPHLNSTEYSVSGLPVATIDTTSPSTSYASCRPGAITFAAGALLGISMVSDATLAPTNTTDFDAILWVSLNPD